MGVGEAVQVAERELPRAGFLAQAPADVFRAGDPECASAGVEMAQVGLGKVASELIHVEAVCTARRLGGEGILRRAAAVLDQSRALQRLVASW